MRISGVKKQGAGTDGFTLIETIITLVILSIAAVGVLSVFTVGIKGSANPLIINQAIALAQEKIETIIGDRENSARGFAWVAAADYNTNPLKYTPENPVAGFANYSRAVTISCVTQANVNTPTGNPPCASGYARVTVTVTNATLGNVSADTLLTNY
jgi:prepilin-type N-terminal cleavage/methylation domain-containing protein